MTPYDDDIDEDAEIEAVAQEMFGRPTAMLNVGEWRSLMAEFLRRAREDEHNVRRAVAQADLVSPDEDDVR